MSKDQSDPPSRPGLYPSRHVPLTDDDDREPTAVTRAILARLDEGEARHLRAKLTFKSSPPSSGKPGWQVAQAVAVAVIVAALSAAATIWRNDGVSAANQAANVEATKAVATKLHEHENLWMHAGSREAIATERAQIDALNERIKRIEAQLDAPRRPR